MYYFIKGEKTTNQENCLKKKKKNKHFHLQTFLVIFLIIFYIGIGPFNSNTNVNSTDIVILNHSTEFEGFPKKNSPILPVQPVLHSITPPDYDAPYTVSLSWDQLINATSMGIFRSTTKNYSAAVEIGSSYPYNKISYIDSESTYNGKILGNTYYYFIRAFNEEGFINSNWQNVTLPRVLFNQPPEIKLSDVIFTVKSLTVLDFLIVHYKVGEDEGRTSHVMHSSTQKSEDGYYIYTNKVRIDSEGPLYYWYTGHTQTHYQLDLGNESNPLISAQDIKVTTDHFKLIVKLTVIVAEIIVAIILYKKVKNLL